jgi:WD40 repeat protein
MTTTDFLAGGLELGPQISGVSGFPSWSRVMSTMRIRIFLTPYVGWLIATWICLFATVRLHAVGPLPSGGLDVDAPAAGSLARLGTLRWRLASSVYTLSWPSGCWWAVAGGGGGHESARVYDGGSGAGISDLLVGEYSAAVLGFPGEGEVVSLGGTFDFPLRFLNWRTGVRSVHKLAAESWVLAAARNKPLVAAYAAGRSVKLFDPRTGDLVRTLELGIPRPRAMALSPDGSILATAPEDAAVAGRISLWATRDGTAAGVLDCGKVRVGSLAFSPCGTKLFSVDTSGLRLWDVPTLRQVRSAPGTGCLAVSPDGKLLADSRGREVRLYSADTLVLVRTIPDCGGSVRAAAFSPDSRRLVTAGSLHSLRVWDVETGRELHVRPGHHSAVVALRFSPDGSRLATRGHDETVRVWDVRTRRQMHTLPLGVNGSPQPFSTHMYPSPAASLDWSPDGSRLAATGGNTLGGLPVASVLVWDATDLAQPPRELRDPEAFVHSAAFTADGSRLLAASAGRGKGGVRFWSPGGDLLDTLNDPEPEERRPGEFRQDIASAVPSPDGRLLAVAGQRKVVVFDLPTRTHLGTLARNERGKRTGPESLQVASAAFSPDGRLLAVVYAGADEERTSFITLHEARSGVRLAVLPVKFPAGVWATLHAAAFSPDGRLLAAAGGDGSLRVWDVYSGKQLHRFEGHGGGALCVAFSPDGRLLAGGGMDTTALLWDASRLRPALPARGGDIATLAARALKGSPAESFAALPALAAHGDDMLSHLPATLRPVPRLDRGAFRALIARLDADDPQERDRAAAALAKLGHPAEGLYREALAGRLPAETRRRLQRLLDAAGAKPGPEAEAQARGMLALELAGTPEARALLMRLAAGEPGAKLTRQALAALGRLNVRSGR